jgi:hypothetical protein
MENYLKTEVLRVEWALKWIFVRFILMSKINIEVNIHLNIYAQLYSAVHLWAYCVYLLLLLESFEIDVIFYEYCKAQYIVNHIQVFTSS